MNRRLLRTLPFAAVMAAGAAILGQGAIIPAKAVVAQVLLDRAFAAGQAAHRPVKAWPWADAAPVSRISAPRLGVSQVVLSGGSGEAMAFGPTLLPGSAAPGERGTAVFAAHRDTHFRFLKDLRRGDAIVVETLDGGRMTYRVTGAAVVRKDRFGIDPYARPSIALTTCWPFGAHEHGPWRYVLSAVRTV